MNKNIKKLTLTALLSTLTFIMTSFFAIPTAIGGSINAGDGLVLLSGIILGPLHGGLSAALGSAFADLISPYAIYTPATFIIKGLMAVSVAILFKGLNKMDLKLRLLIPAIIAETIMILGYFLFEAYILDFGAIVASYEIINNIIQASVSIILLLIIYIPLSKTKLINELN